MKEIISIGSSISDIFKEKIIKNELTKDFVNSFDNEFFIESFSFTNKYGLTFKIYPLTFACISDNLSNVKAFEDKFHIYKTRKYDIGFLEFIRKNNLSEDIYDYLLEKGFEDNLQEIEKIKEKKIEKEFDIIPQESNIKNNILKQYTDPQVDHIISKMSDEDWNKDIMFITEKVYKLACESRDFD